MKKTIKLSSTVCVVLFMVVIFCPFDVWAVRPLKVCELFTKAEAGEIFKEAISSERARKTTAPAGDSCTYFYKKKGDVYSVAVKISSSGEIKQEGIFKSAKDVFDRQKRVRIANEGAAKLMQKVPIPLVDAFWSGSDLWILKGDYLVTVLVRSHLAGKFKNTEEMARAQADQDLEYSKKVAEKVLPEIK